MPSPCRPANDGLGITPGGKESPGGGPYAMCCEGKGSWDAVIEPYRSSCISGDAAGDARRADIMAGSAKDCDGLNLNCCKSEEAHVVSLCKICSFDQQAYLLTQAAGNDHGWH